MRCCSKGALVAPIDTGPLRETLRRASKAHLGVKLAFVVSGAGEVIASEGAPVENFSAEKLAPQIQPLRRSIAQLGGCSEPGAACPAVHMRGLTHVISIFDVPESQALVLVSEAHPAVAELFDTVAVEERMTPIVEELSALLMPGGG